MALFENGVAGFAESGAAAGLAIGIGALFLIPGLLPAVGSAMRSIAVGTIKTGMVIYDQASARVRETTGDLIAEARTQLEAGRQDAAGSADATSIADSTWFR